MSGALWSNPAGSWCQKFSEVGVRAPAMVASQTGLRSLFLFSNNTPLLISINTIFGKESIHCGSKQQPSYNMILRYDSTWLTTQKDFSLLDSSITSIDLRAASRKLVDVKTQCQFGHFLIGAFRSVYWYKFCLSHLFRSVFDVYTLKSVRRKKLLSMPENV